MKSRAAIRDVGRALDMKYPDVDRIAKLVPSGSSRSGKRWNNRPNSGRPGRKNPAVGKLLDYASRIEGLARHWFAACSRHCHHS